MIEDRRFAVLLLPHDPKQLGTDSDYRLAPAVAFDSSCLDGSSDFRHLAALVAETLHVRGLSSDVIINFKLRAQFKNWPAGMKVCELYFGDDDPTTERTVLGFLESLHGRSQHDSSLRLPSQEGNPGLVAALIEHIEVSRLEDWQDKRMRALLVEEQARLSNGRVPWDLCEADHLVGLYYILVRMWQIVNSPLGAEMAAADVIEFVTLCVNAANSIELAMLTSVGMNQVAAQVTKQYVVLEKELSSLGWTAHHTHWLSEAGEYNIGQFLTSRCLRRRTLDDMAGGYEALARELLRRSRSSQSRPVARALVALAERTFHDLLRLLADADPDVATAVRAAVGPRAAPTFSRSP